MNTFSYDRDAVRFLVALGGLWVSDHRYVSIQHVRCQYERWPYGVPEYYDVGINTTSLEGTRFYQEKWEDLAPAVRTAVLRKQVHDNAANTVHISPDWASELWTMHRTLDSALDMIEAILQYPIRFTYGYEWADVVEHRVCTVVAADL